MFYEQMIYGLQVILDAAHLTSKKYDEPYLELQYLNL